MLELDYRHLSQISFETDEQREEIRQKGLEQERKGEVTPLALELGKQFHPKILSAYISRVSVQFVSDEVGFGLFAEECIQPHQYVGEYTGIVRKNDRRYFEPLNNYCYEYPLLDEIGRNYVVDATQGNLTRFINHRKEPNLKPLYAYWEGFYHVIFIAIQVIEVGQQLSYDYGESYWYLREKPTLI